MVFQLLCELHQQPRDKICGLSQCCKAMCTNCLSTHQIQTGHLVIVTLNSRTINFFNSFNGYIHYKMIQWMDLIRSQSYLRIFDCIAEDNEIWKITETQQEIKRMCLEVLEDYKNLMQNNRQFVLKNENNENLYHPMFLRDIYNLITQKWEMTARMITDNLGEKLMMRWGSNKDIKLPEIIINKNTLTLVQNHRLNLMNKLCKNIIYEIKQNIIDNTNQTNDSEVKQNQEMEISRFEAYQLPYSITQIQSFEEIGHRKNYSRKSIYSVFNDHENENVKQLSQQNKKKINIHTLLKDMERLQLENLALRQENQLVKKLNNTLQEDNQCIRAKYEKLLCDNKQRSASAKKSQNVDPNSQLLSQLVELEVEMTDSQHDIRVLTDYINELTSKSFVKKEEVNRKLSVLKTIEINN